MNNEDVYNQTKANKWSIVIKKRRMRWLGHVMRLPKQTPARKAIQYANEKYVRPRGRSPTTWLIMKKQLIEDHKLTWLEECDIAKDRIMWNKYSK